MIAPLARKCEALEKGRGCATQAPTLTKQTVMSRVRAARAKGSVALGPLPNLLGSVPEARQGDAHRGKAALSGQSAGETLDTLYQSSHWNNKIVQVPRATGCSAKVPEAIAREWWWRPTSDRLSDGQVQGLEALAPENIKDGSWASVERSDGMYIPR